MELVVAGITIGSVRTAVSVDGGTSFFPGISISGACDPSLAASPSDGRFWLAVKQSIDLVVAYKQPDDTWWDFTFVSDVGQVTDKPWIAIGPRFDQPQTMRTYIGRMWKKPQHACQDDEANWFSWSDTPDQGASAWTTIKATPASGGVCDYAGLGTMPVVLDDGTLVVALRDHDPGHATKKYNDNKPYVYRSLDSGATWIPASGDGI